MGQPSCQPGLEKKYRRKEKYKRNDKKKKKKMREDKLIFPVRGGCEVRLI